MSSSITEAVSEPGQNKFDLLKSLTEAMDYIGEEENTSLDGRSMEFLLAKMVRGQQVILKTKVESAAFSHDSSNKGMIIKELKLKNDLL